jgi:hypothetical protein
MPSQAEIDAATAAISTTIRPEWRREVARTALAAAELVRDKAWEEYLARHEHTPERWIGDGHMEADTTAAMDEVRRQMRPTDTNGLHDRDELGFPLDRPSPRAARRGTPHEPDLD